MKKRIFVTVLAVVMMFTTSLVCFAGQSNFSQMKIFVDSNQWTYMAFAYKDTNSADSSVLITKMYDAAGNLRNDFNFLHVKAGSNGNAYVAQKGYWSYLKIPSSCQMAGFRIKKDSEQGLFLVLMV